MLPKRFLYLLGSFFIVILVRQLYNFSCKSECRAFRKKRVREVLCHKSNISIIVISKIISIIYSVIGKRKS